MARIERPGLCKFGKRSEEEEIGSDSMTGMEPAGPGKLFKGRVPPWPPWHSACRSCFLAPCFAKLRLKIHDDVPFLFLRDLRASSAVCPCDHQRSVYPLHRRTSESTMIAWSPLRERSAGPKGAQCPTFPTCNSVGIQSYRLQGGGGEKAPGGSIGVGAGSVNSAVELL